MRVKPVHLDIAGTAARIEASIRLHKPGPPVEHNIDNEEIARSYLAIKLTDMQLKKLQPTEEYWQTEVGQTVAAIQWWLNEGNRLTQRDAVYLLWGETEDLSDAAVYNRLSQRFIRMKLPRYRRPSSTIQENFYKKGVKNQNQWYYVRDDVEAARTRLK